MKPQPAESGLLARTVRETLECFASPEVTREVIAAALDLSGRTDIPEAGRTVMVFVENALFAAVEDRLGTETAMMIVDQLRPIASMASAQEVSEVRPTTPPLGLFEAASDAEGGDRVTARPPTPALVLDMSDDDPTLPRPASREVEVHTDDDDEPELTFGSADDEDPDLDWDAVDWDGDPEWASGDPTEGDSIGAEAAAPPSEESRTPTSPPTAEAIRKRRALASQARRPPSSPRRRAQWTEPEPDLLRVVLVCTADPMRAAGMGRAMAGTARVQPISDALAILSEPADLVVVDCVRPTVRLETLLSVAPELPEGCRVVLWGEAPDFRKQLGILASAIPDTWVSCGVDAEAEDVAAVCRVLLE